jgi:polysaccharide export outer membrane protein
MIRLPLSAHPVFRHFVAHFVQLRRFSTKCSTKSPIKWLAFLSLALLPAAWPQDTNSPAPSTTTTASARSTATPNPAAPVPDTRAYVLRPADIVQVNVYQEDDMGAKARLEKDGTILLPLLGKVQIGGKNLEDASKAIRDLLAKDYLVNPQVSVTVAEYAKRRFIVLGQVQRPGSYEMPNEESLNLLQAIAMAGGYTRIGAPGKVTVQRVVNDEPKTFKLDAEAMSKDKNVKQFDIMPDDTITVGERLL